MLKSVIYLLLLNFLFATEGYACDIKDMTEFALQLSKKYKSKQLEVLDTKHTFSKPIRVIYEHSIPEKEEFENFTVSSLAEMQSVLDERESEGFPVREIKNLLKCEKETCLYDFSEGIYHNHLYLYEVWYEGTETCATVSAIHLYDGD